MQRRDLYTGNSLANRLLCKEDNAFWEEIKKINNCNNISIANSIDNVL